MAFGDVTMELWSEDRGDVTVVGIRGRVSIGKVEDLNEFLKNLLEAGKRRFVLDLSEMEHVVSGGIGVLIGFNEKLKGVGGTTCMARVHPRVQRIFTMMSLDAFFRIYEGVDEAVASYAADPS